MNLTINKKFEFSASHSLSVKDLSDTENLALYGRAATGKYGHGHNYEAYFIFEGPVNETTGMMINVTDIKKIIGQIINEKYDHHYLNEDTAPFDKIVPTAENIARKLLDESIPLFNNHDAKPIACHLIESPVREVTAYADGRIESHFHLDFSAARVTRSPFLSDEENIKLFKEAASPSGHGHHYRLRVTIAGEVDNKHGMIIPEVEVSKILKEIYHKFDHKNINIDIPEFKELPTTTEVITGFIYDYLKSKLPVKRVRLNENDNFFVECHGEQYRMASVDGFYAAHRLHSDKLSDKENLEIFDKCNNPRGHGHRYQLETTINGELDKRSGVLYDLEKLMTTVRDVITPWDFRHLNLDTKDFTGKVTTGENIIDVLWNKLNPKLDSRLTRLRLWETENNRFSLRK